MHDACHAATKKKKKLASYASKRGQKGSLQKPGRKDGGDSEFFLQRHLKARYQNHGKEEDCEIRDDVDRPTRHEDSLIVETVTRKRRGPQLLPWNTRPDFDRHIGDVEEQIEPNEDMNYVIGFAPTVRNKYPEKEQQNGKLGGENNWIVDYLDDICQLSHIPRSVTTKIWRQSSTFRASHLHPFDQVFLHDIPLMHAREFDKQGRQLETAVYDEAALPQAFGQVSQMTPRKFLGRGKFAPMRKNRRLTAISNGVQKGE